MTNVLSYSAITTTYVSFLCIVLGSKVEIINLINSIVVTPWAPDGAKKVNTFSKPRKWESKHGALIPKYDVRKVFYASSIVFNPYTIQYTVADE